MRYFIAKVYPMRVQIDEQVKELQSHDCSAVVDGDIWRYKIKKSANIAKRSIHWRSRACHHIHYHAHNSGEVVRFEPVHYQARNRRKISEKQLSLF